MIVKILPTGKINLIVKCGINRMLGLKLTEETDLSEKKIITFFAVRVSRSVNIARNCRGWTWDHVRP